MNRGGNAQSAAALMGVPSMLAALERVLSPARFPYASDDYLFRDTYFGRDALEVSEDLLEIRPEIARSVILRLASLQGTRVDARSEEEPGKIHHEYRALTIDGKEVTPAARELFHTLARQWRLSDDPNPTEFITYWTVDATPLYVRLVARYCRRYGNQILLQRYVPRGGGEALTIAESARRAANWIAHGIDSSSLGLLEFQRSTPRSHRFQAWKDGATSYLHPDGRLANYLGPIASIEVQGLAFDALTAACRLPLDAGEEEVQGWAQAAERVRAGVFAHFWIPEERYFAFAIDRDERTGAARQVRLIVSNPGALLGTRVFDALDASGRKRFVIPIVERIWSPEFLTPVGVRCTSLMHKDVLGYPGYQSSHTVWHKETYDIANGLRRQGFPALARELDTRLLNAVNVTGRATEYLYVLPDGRVDYAPTSRPPSPKAEQIPATNVPENDQAWTISAALAIKWHRGRRGRAVPPETALEARLLTSSGKESLLCTVQDVHATRERSPAFWINTERGREKEEAFLQVSGVGGTDT